MQFPIQYINIPKCLPTLHMLLTEASLDLIQHINECFPEIYVYAGIFLGGVGERASEWASELDGGG